MKFEDFATRASKKIRGIVFVRIAYFPIISRPQYAAALQVGVPKKGRRLVSARLVVIKGESRWQDDHPLESDGDSASDALNELIRWLAGSTLEITIGRQKHRLRVPRDLTL